MIMFKRPVLRLALYAVKDGHQRRWYVRNSSLFDVANMVSILRDTANELEAELKQQIETKWQEKCHATSPELRAALGALLNDGVKPKHEPEVKSNG